MTPYDPSQINMRRQQFPEQPGMPPPGVQMQPVDQGMPAPQPIPQAGPAMPQPVPPPAPIPPPATSMQQQQQAQPQGQAQVQPQTMPRPAYSGIAAPPVARPQPQRPTGGSQPTPLGQPANMNKRPTPMGA